MLRPFSVSLDGALTEIVFEESLYGVDPTSRIFLAGSFNGWLSGSVVAGVWELIASPETPGVRTCIKPSAAFNVPGNSGYPEYIFLQFKEDNTFSKLTLPEIAGCFTFLGNNILFSPDDNYAEIQCLETEAKKIRLLAEFDLSSMDSVAEISNFRRVPGCNNLFRSYHPYKKSFPEFDTEITRSLLVKKGMEQEGIASVICLCGNESPDPAKGEELSLYHKNIIKKQNELFAETSYESAYFGSAGTEFGLLFAEIVRFINSHPAPFLVHCRLGSDRTGVVCALLAALCRTSWDDIAADFEKTGRMGIQQYRDARILKYSLEKMIGRNIERKTDLQHEISSYFIKSGYLSCQDLIFLNKTLL